MTRDDEAVQRYLPLLPRDFYILFFLADGERHGYGLVKSIAEHTQGQLRLDPANLYRAIQKLALAGLVADGARRANESGRERRYYRITALGRRVAAAEAERMRALANAAEAHNLIPSRRPRR